MQRSDTKNNESVLFKFENLNIKNTPTVCKDHSKTPSTPTTPSKMSAQYAMTDVSDSNTTPSKMSAQYAMTDVSDSNITPGSYTFENFDEIKWLTGC